MGLDEGHAYYAFSHQPFSNMFLMYTIFFTILNLFDSDKLYALSTHYRKCMNKMHHIWRSIQICMKIIQKAR